MKMSSQGSLWESQSWHLTCESQICGCHALRLRQAYPIIPENDLVFDKKGQSQPLESGCGFLLS